MTDNEIIKALEICSRRNGGLPCEACPAYSISQMCMEDLMSDAFDLINRQKAEIERLQDELHRAKVEISKHYDYMDGAANEAIDVFANSLKIKLNRMIDNLVKEMTEVEE